MGSSLNKIVMAVAFFLVFFAGYFTHSLFETNSAAKKELNKISSQINQDTHIRELVPESRVSNSSGLSKEQIASVQVLSKAAGGQNFSSATRMENRSGSLVESRPESNSPKEISDEEIDKELPEPFNSQLKHIHGALREKYKSFADSNAPLDWDVDKKNKLSAAIYSNPNSNYIKLDSLECRANLCEIRVYELKRGAWLNIQSGMALESWWDFGIAHADGFDTTSGTGVYVLLVRR